MFKSRRSREEFLKLAEALGSRPSLDEIKKLQGLAAELVDGGDWRMCQPLATLCGKSIWVMSDYGQRNIRSLSREAKAEILHQATWGLLNVNAFMESGGKKVDQAIRDKMEKFGREFVKNIELVKAEQFGEVPPKVRRCGICGQTTASDEYDLTEAGLFVCAKCHNYGYGDDPIMMDCPSCGYRFDAGDNRVYFEEYRCAHCGAALEKREIPLF